VWTSGDEAVKNPELLLRPNTGQSDIFGSGMCVLDSKGGKKASIILDFGRELHGGLSLYFSSVSPAKTPVIRLRFGESLSETCSELNSKSLVDTGSKMDDVVYEEFKGTGNMELILDRKLQEKRVFPAIDIVKSGTRREDLLLTPKELRAVDLMRRRMNGLKPEDAVESILNAFARFPTNEQVVNQVLAKWGKDQ
jgi:hypothetical protein